MSWNDTQLDNKSVLLLNLLLRYDLRSIIQGTNKYQIWKWLNKVDIFLTLNETDFILIYPIKSMHDTCFENWIIGQENNDGFNISFNKWRIWMWL